jgi:hypothetical protein
MLVVMLLIAVQVSASLSGYIIRTYHWTYSCWVSSNMASLLGQQ